VAILDSRMVPFTPGMIGRLSMATGVPVATIKKAWELKEWGYRPSLPTRRSMVEQDRLVTQKLPSLDMTRTTAATYERRTSARGHGRSRNRASDSATVAAN
jgi:hypothetical protein